MTSIESTSECKAKYVPQKNHPVPVPANIEALPKRKTSSRSKRKSRKHKSKSVDDDDDDFTSAGGKHKRSYLKNCIKKRLNNNYEKQINCHQDENMTFTDNKIYISLAARNSISSTSGGYNSLKKKRRVIYPTRSGYKLSGFLRDYDFNYESPKKAAISWSKNDEHLEFNLAPADCVLPATSLLENVVFEKVKVSNKKGSDDCHHLSVNNVDEGSAALPSSMRMSDWENRDTNLCETDDDEDAQWMNFLALRKIEKTDSEVQKFDDSGFGSQLFSNLNAVEKNIDSSRTYEDDESFDNCFNEELEHRVAVELPDLYKQDFHPTYLKNINDTSSLNTNYEQTKSFEKKLYQV